MRRGVNRACMQSLFLQLVDAADALSRRYTISQLWPACTWARGTGGLQSNRRTQGGIKFLVDTRHELPLSPFQRVIFPVCFILMPSCCQLDKTFATEAVAVQSEADRVATLLLNDNSAVSCFTLTHSQRESVLFFYWSLFLYKQRWYIGLVIGGLDYTPWKWARSMKKVI